MSKEERKFVGIFLHYSDGSQVNIWELEKGLYDFNASCLLDDVYDLEHHIKSLEEENNKEPKQQ